MMRTRTRLVAVVAGLVAAAVAAAWWIDSADDRRFRARVEELRREGFAVTCAEAVGTAPPGAEKAGFAILLAYGDLGRGPGLPWSDGRDLPGPWNPNSGEDWHRKRHDLGLAKLADWLEAARPFFDEVAAAAERPAWRFPFRLDAAGWADEGTSPLAQEVQMLLTARALAARVPADRLLACRTQLRLGRRFVAITMMDTFAGAAIEAGGVHALRKGVTSGRLDAAAARRCVDADLAPLPPDWRESVARRELAWVATVWESVLRGYRPTWLPRPTMKDRMAALWRRISGRGPRSRGLFDEASSASMTKCLDFWASLARGERAWQAANEAPPVAVLDTVTFNVDERARRIDALHALARVALAVRERRDAAGSWPKSLEEVRDLLGGAVPADPFTGAPFVYERTAEAVRISSAGRRPADPDVSAEDLRERGLVWEFPADPAK